MSSLNATHYLLDAKLRRGDITSFDQYPFNLDAIRNLDKIDFHPKVTFIVGENGSGKSTLLEAIATNWGFNPEGGTKNFSFSTQASHSNLHEYIILGKSFRKAKDGFFLRAESFYNVATNIDMLDEGGGGRPIINSYGGKSLHHQSHGESFFALMKNRFGGNGLYILDEPEAALSPSRQIAMLSIIQQLVDANSQFIISTHSPILMAYPDAIILCLDQHGITETKYEETEHFLVTQTFLNQHKNMLKKLFS